MIQDKSKSIFVSNFIGDFNNLRWQGNHLITNTIKKKNFSLYDSSNCQPVYHEFIMIS